MFSIVATETSVLTFISVPGLAYRSDWFFLQLAFGYIFGKEKFPLRVGMSYGGYDKKSFGFGWGLRLGKINFDAGIGLKGSLDLDKSNGLDFGFNMYWMGN